MKENEYIVHTNHCGELTVSNSEFIELKKSMLNRDTKWVSIECVKEVMQSSIGTRVYSFKRTLTIRKEDVTYMESIKTLNNE